VAIQSEEQEEEHWFFAWEAISPLEAPSRRKLPTGKFVPAQLRAEQLSSEVAVVVASSWPQYNST
jgi:hypothetical protein